MATIGSGLLSGSQTVAQGFREGRQNIRAQATAKAAGIQQEFKNSIAKETQRIAQEGLKLKQQLREDAIQDKADLIEKEEGAIQANKNIFTQVSSANKNPKLSGQLLSEGLGELGAERVDTKKDLMALSQIPKADRTPKINELIGDMEKAEKLGAKSFMSAPDALSGVKSPDALMSGIKAIPEEAQTPFTQSIGGVGEQTRGLSIAEQEANIEESIRQNPDFFNQDPADQEKILKQLEASIVDPDAGIKMELEAETALLDNDILKLKRDAAQADFNKQLADAKNPQLDFSVKDMLAQYGGRKELKDLNTVMSAYEKVKFSSDPENHTAGADLSLIFAFMRILDPSSVVRESEFDTATKAQERWKIHFDKEGIPMPERLKQAFAQLTEGQILLPQTREDFLRIATGNYHAQISTAAPTIEQYMTLEKDAGHKEGHVVPSAHRGIVKDHNERQAQLGRAKQAQAPQPQQTPSGLNYTISVTQ